jgi:cysteine desulfuration protein SufE
MSPYPAPLQEAIETFALLDDPADRVDLLLSYADRFREVPPQIATRPFPKEQRVPACESEAYVWAVPQSNGTLALYFAVENPAGVSANALAAILEQTLSGLPPEEIERVPPDLIYDLFRQNISMGKGMGLMAMVQAVCAIARHAARRG